MTLITYMYLFRKQNDTLITTDSAFLTTATLLRCLQGAKSIILSDTHMAELTAEKIWVEENTSVVLVVSEMALIFVN
jgi:hypothetical protein